MNTTLQPPNDRDNSKCLSSAHATLLQQVWGKSKRQILRNPADKQTHMHKLTPTLKVKIEGKRSIQDVQLC